MKKITLTFLMSLISTSISANIFDNMDKETSVTTGIYKLSSNEKEALMKWLDSSSKKTTKASKEVLKQEIKAEIVAENKQKEEVAKEIIKKNKTKNMGFRKKESERTEIHTSILGEFKGWKGKNIFKLANGQVWKQAEKTTFYIPKRNNPNITIKPKSMGSWQLYVDGFSRGVKVRRVK